MKKIRKKWQTFSGCLINLKKNRKIIHLPNRVAVNMHVLELL